MMFSVGIMAVATGIFFLFPEKLVQIFSTESAIVAIGNYAFPVISVSFVFAGLTIVITSYLQGIEHIIKSFYHCVTPDHSSCSAGVVISFYKFKCSVVDISGYRDHCQYSRYIYNIYFIKTSVK